MPSSGEIAMPVTVEIAPAIGAPGDRSGTAGVGLAASAANANGAMIIDRVRAKTNRGRSRFIARP